MTLTNGMLQEMIDAFNKKIQSNPNLYLLGDGGLNVTLPKEICWTYSNRAAGDSGGAEPRPVGIRILPNRIPKQNRKLRDEIFSSTSRLKSFIESSECDGAEHLARKMVKKASKTRSNISAGFLELELLQLAVETRDAGLAKMVLKGDAARFQKMVDNMSADLL